MLDRLDRLTSLREWVRGLRKRRSTEGPQRNFTLVTSYLCMNTAGTAWALFAADDAKLTNVYFCTYAWALLRSSQWSRFTTR